MNNENNGFEVVELNNTQANPETPIVVRTLKRQPGLGRLNRLIKATTDLVVANGHTKKHFKRNYSTGTATYQCPNCNASVVVKLEQGVGQTSKEGDALVLKCSVVNS
jgi:hypothetical protein